MTRFFYWAFVTVIILLLIWTNIQLYQPTLTETEKQKDIVKQLYFLEDELKEHELGGRMQAIFPEGFVFVHALYGLAWAELALQTSDPNMVDKALEESIFSFSAIDSDNGKSSFYQTNDLNYGIFYQGWRNYLLAKILSIPYTFPERQQYVERFAAQCEEIAKAFSGSETPYLTSYPEMAWPADSFLAMASLAIHDRVFLPKYRGVIQRWLEQVRFHRSPYNNMLAHKVDADSGDMLEASRGGSMSLMLRMLVEISPEFAKEQYDLFKEHFVSTALGLPKVREYPKGTFGFGDIDSGPVILGTSFAGTIVSIGTFQAFGEMERADRQYKTVDAFGFSQTNAESKSYLFGSLPMADAFIVWARATPVYVKSEQGSGSFWRLRFQLTSLLIPSLLVAFYYRKRLMRKINRKRPDHE